MQKLLFIASTRIPTERAMGVAIMKQCEAFSRAGLTVELVVPKRYNERTEDPYVYHDVERIFSIRFLRSLDLTFLGECRMRFRLQQLTFFISLCLYIACSNADILYSRELIFVAPLITTKKKFVELHHLNGLRFFGTVLLNRCTGIIAITKALSDDIVRLFIYKKSILIAPSGVDIHAFTQSTSKEIARIKLGIITSLPVAMYIGALEEWKGYRTFLDALRLLQGTIQGVVIGGSSTQLAVLRKEYPEVLFLGTLPQRDLADNQQAADVLVVPNSAREIISARHTSPLKVFAHMASNIPLVASAVPSITEILGPRNAFLVTPDDSADLARGIREALDNRQEAGIRATQALQEVGYYDWSVRTKSILAVISKKKQPHDKVFARDTNLSREAKNGHPQIMNEDHNFHWVRVIKNYCISNRREIAKYILVGGVATVVDLSTNYILNFYIWYLYASIFAFFLTFSTSFILQKFWTFREQRLSRIPAQLSISLSFALVILMLNTTLMYVLVSYGHIHYLYARIVVLGILALLSYIVNKFIIFR